MKVVNIWVKNIKEGKYKIEDVPFFIREDVVLTLKDELLDKESNLFIGESSLLTIVKEVKIEKLKHICNQKIIDGFTLDNEHYSYSQEKQINFQDTYQLFLNNMITEISWNVYIDGEKTRVLLDKDKFQRVYLAGVKHKVDTMSRLNDVLIPMVNNAESKEVVARIYWDEGLDSESLELDIENTMGKKIEKVEKTAKEVQDSSLTTMMALMQISAMIK